MRRAITPAALVGTSTVTGRSTSPAFASRTASASAWWALPAVTGTTERLTPAIVRWGCDARWVAGPQVWASAGGVGQLAKLADGVGEALGIAIQGAPGDQHVGARFHGAADRRRPDPAVDLEVD